MRALSVLVSFSLLASCDGWGEPVEGEGSPPLPQPTPRDAGNDCTAITALVSAASPQVNGAFCFGVASGASEFLACAPLNASATECADQVLGTAYLVQWTGDRGQVFLTRGGPSVATISQREPGVFEIESTLGQDGLCRLGRAAAEFCKFVP